MRRRGPGPARVSGAALGDGCALIGGWWGGLPSWCEAAAGSRCPAPGGAAAM